MLWGLTGLLAVMAVFVGASTWRAFGTMATVKAERVSAETERDALKVRTEELQASLGDLGTSRGLEAEIRSRYPLVKPGEVEFVFVDKADEGVVDTSDASRESVWSSLRSWLGL